MDNSVASPAPEGDNQLKWYHSFNIGKTSESEDIVNTPELPQTPEPTFENAYKILCVAQKALQGAIAKNWCDELRHRSQGSILESAADLDKIILRLQYPIL